MQCKQSALQLLDVSREVINATVAALWHRLDDFGKRETKYAYKQVTAMIGSPDSHGDRQWRCEAEQAGRILRGQAERKKQFALILPLLEQGMILPKTEKKPAGKNRTAIKAALADLREEDTDGGSAVELQSLIEQAAISTSHTAAFPRPMKRCRRSQCRRVASCRMRQTMAASMARRIGCASIWKDAAAISPFALQIKQDAGPPHGPSRRFECPCLDPVVERLQAGEDLAPTLREIAEPDGTRYAVLDFIIEVPVTPLPEPTAGAAGARMGLGREDAGDGDGAGPLRQSAFSSLVPGHRRLRWAAGPHPATH